MKQASGNVMPDGHPANDPCRPLKDPPTLAPNEVRLPGECVAWPALQGDATLRAHGGAGGDHGRQSGGAVSAPYPHEGLAVHTEAFARPRVPAAATLGALLEWGHFRKTFCDDYRRLGMRMRSGVIVSARVLFSFSPDNRFGPECL